MANLYLKKNVILQGFKFVSRLYCFKFSHLADAFYPEELTDIYHNVHVLERTHADTELQHTL